MAKKKKSRAAVQIVKKDVRIRGMLVEELQALDVREAAKFLPSRSRRTVLRNFDVVQRFLTRCADKTKKGNKIRTHERDMIIVPGLVGLTIGIYNGKEFRDVEIIGEMIGHRLGEFSPTRNRVNHGSAGIGATKSSRTQKK